MINKDEIFKFEIFSIILTMLLGTLFHFTFDLSGSNLIVALFSSTNESTWEHLKLLFFPMLVSTVIGFFKFGNKNPNFLCARFWAIISSILFTIVFFYTYSGILGFNIAFIDIASFYVAVLVGEYISYKILISNNRFNNKLCSIFIFLLLLAFVLFTFFPPKIGLFLDPVSKEFGII